MAAGGLRVVRRSDSGPRRALTAASAPVENPQQIFKAGIGRRDNWQDEAWELYYLVGELRYFVAWLSGSCGRCKLVGSELDEDGQPTGSIDEKNPDAKKIAAAIHKIAGGSQGQSELIKRAAKQLTVPGECWVAILQTTVGEQWFVITRDEMKPDGKTVIVMLPDGTQHKFDQSKGDAMFRVWNPDPRKAWLPDSTVRGVIPALREIVKTTETIEQAANSRLANSGVLFVPSEASLPATNAPVSADKVGDDGTGPIEQPQVSAARAMQDVFVEVASETAKNPRSPARFVPLVGSAPGEHLDKIKYFPLSQEITSTALDTREKATNRLAMGLDVSVERITGMGSTNHWSSWSIGDDDVQLHISPVMHTFCQAIYDGTLANVLREMGVDASKYTLWFDASGLTADPDKTDEIKDAFAQGVANGGALLSYYGLSADSGYDLDTDDGKAQWALDMIGRDPSLVTTLHVLIPQLADVDFPAPAPALPPGQQQNPDDISGADQQQEPATEDTNAGADDGQAAIGATALSLLIEERITRALGLAGKRRIDTGDSEQRARLRGIEPHRWHLLMEPVAEHEIPRLVKGWDEGLAELAVRRRFDAERVRLVVLQEVRKQLTTQVVDV